MNHPSAAQPVLVETPKSMGVAILLAFLFGPLGLLYATVKGGLIMMGISVLVGIVTFGLGLVVIWPVCMVWAAVASKNHNERLAGARN